MHINLDVLPILDALDKRGSFAVATKSLLKIPAALSCMIQKLEGDLSIEPLNRSGHRAELTNTGQMMLEKGCSLLSATKDLEKQAMQLSSDWEKEPAIVLGDPFPFAALLPIVGELHTLNKRTRLGFTHHTLAGSWKELTHNGIDIALGATNEPSTPVAWPYKMLDTLDNVLAVAPKHPLVATADDLANEQLRLHRAIAISDSTRFCHPLRTNLMEEQVQIRVDDFRSKVMLLRVGMGCEFLPRHIASPWPTTGELVEKTVISFRQKDAAYMTWHNSRDELAQRWWRETLLANPEIARLYQ